MRKRVEVHDSRSLDQALASVHLERIQLNFSWLLKLRWAAVLGQLLTVAVVHYWIGLELPREKLLVIIAIAAMTNVALVFWFKTKTKTGMWDGFETSGEFLIGSIMTLDLFLLTGLLYVTGGPSNPFTIFYLVNCTLSAVVLRPLWGWILGVEACLCYAALFLGNVPLDALIPNVEAASPDIVLQHAWELHRVGMFVAFATAAGILLYFFSRVFVERARLEQELLVMRQRHAKGQRLEAMATLAAGAAHELSSPLSTIAVVAKELEREASKPGLPPTMQEDSALIRDEVRRCRRILDRMSADAGESAGEALVPIEIEALFEEVLQELPQRDRVRVKVAPDLAGLQFNLPPVALSQAFRGLVHNAIDASGPEQEVDLIGEILEPRPDRSGGIRLLVQDRGAGMEPATLERVGTPFFTTKEVGSGTGLGIFLARTVVERLGGQLWIESTPREGTKVHVELPSERVETRSVSHTTAGDTIPRQTSEPHGPMDASDGDVREKD